MRAVLLRAGVMLAAVVYAAALDAATLRFSSQGDITTIDPHSNNEGFTTSYLDNIYEAFQQQPEHVQIASRLTAGAFEERRSTIADLQVVDVRNAAETEDGSVPGASRIPLPTLRDEMEKLDRARPTVVFCAGGYRSSIAASMLRHAGFTDVSDILGGYQAWATAKARTT